MPPRSAWACARSVACEALGPDAGERRSKAFSGGGRERELLERPEKPPGPVRCAYGSGCTGFWLCGFLGRGGVECEVMAVSTLPRPPKNGRRKDDRRDAGVALREMRNPASDVPCAWAPDPEAEGARDLARAAGAAKKEAKPAKRRGSMLLAERGFAWSGRAPAGNLKAAWAPAWRKRALPPDLGDPTSDTAPKTGVETVERMERGAKDLARAVAAEAEKPRWKPYVDAPVRVKGIGVQAAFPACAELGDFPRFKGGRRVSRRLGCAAPEDSSGESRRRGKIAEEGGGRLRRALVEGASAISRQTGRKKYPRPGHEAPASVEGMAVGAGTRPKKKRGALKGAGKRANTAKVAVVSELARWMRAIGLQAQREQAAARRRAYHGHPPRSRRLAVRSAARARRMRSRARPAMKERIEGAAGRVIRPPAARGVCDTARTGGNRAAGRGLPRWPRVCERIALSIRP